LTLVWLWNKRDFNGSVGNHDAEETNCIGFLACKNARVCVEYKNSSACWREIAQANFADKSHNTILSARSLGAYAEVAFNKIGVKHICAEA